MAVMRTVRACQGGRGWSQTKDPSPYVHLLWKEHSSTCEHAHKELVPWYFITMGELTGSFCTNRIYTRSWPWRYCQKTGKYIPALKLSRISKYITVLRKTQLQEKHFSWPNGAELDVTVGAMGSHIRFCKWTTARRKWTLFRWEQHTKFLTYWSPALLHL